MMMRLLSVIIAGLLFITQASAGVVLSPYRYGTPLYSSSLSNILTQLGLTSNLQLALDAGDSASIADPFWSSVQLLLHADGSDAATTFTDESGKTITANGNAQIDTAQSKFGGASGLFDGTGDYLTASDTVFLELSNLSFVIEAWIRPNSTSGTQIIAQKGRTAASNFSYSWYLTGTTMVLESSTNGTSATATLSNNWTRSTGAWYHVAVARAGSTVRMYVDGTQIGTDQTNSDTFFDGAGGIGIGGDNAGGNGFNGWIDDFRLTRSASRNYAFASITVPSAAFPVGKWLDTSGNGYDFFIGAASAKGTDEPTFNGTAGNFSSSEYFSFDGGDFLVYDTANETWMENLHKNNAAFTIAAWVNFASYSGPQMLFADTALLAGTGITLYASGSTVHAAEVMNADAPIFSQTPAHSFGTSAWGFVGLSYNEATGAVIWIINGTATTATATYSAPSSSGASGTVRLGADTASANTIESGGRLAMVMAWSTPLTQAQLANVYAATKGRYQ